ncbi:hypothetical protein, partial [Methylophilus sp.]|uniref:hypothetical protein n=1 Tax=Methylophilus sp. TaxID=29541 RepID=UPI000D40B45B
QMFAMELNWVTLYKILETLETLMKQDSFASPISSTDRKEFTNSANNFSIVGLDSRHGYKLVSKQNKTKAMSLSDGEAMLISAAVQYLKFALK